VLTTVEHELQRTSPEQQGVASSAVLQFVEAVERQVHELHSFMLLRHGSVIAEGWWSPYEPAYPHLMFSLSKSFTSTAIGLAVAEGRFSLGNLVLPFFAEDAPAEVSDNLAAMRIRDLLSMSTGHAVDTWAYMMGRADGDWIRGFLAVPVRHTPGTYFLYNTGATYMLAAILQKTTGIELIDYLKPRLFEPLGIEYATWEESPQGIAAGGIGLSINTEAIARFGQLYLQKGMWQGKQILPEAWITEATAFQISNGNDPDSDWAQGYGYQFWRARHNAYRGDGAFGQYCIVMPEQDAVLAITGGLDALEMQPPLDLVWDLLLPAMDNAPLADDVASHQHLSEKLANLSIPPVQGQASSALAAHVSGRTYKVDANALKIDSITLTFTEAGCTIRVITESSDDTFPCGIGLWQKGQTHLFNDPSQINVPRIHPSPIFASGAWTAEDRFNLVIRVYETPFFHTFVCHFVGDEMIIETWVNASFESRRPLLLTAYSV
jgi:CubicO group peptidase (beta-lactamase class C family)